MELKRLLTRANALLLQGAYQGAEYFIEQAMAESDKIKSELAELDTLRTRVTEMASEVERLQSVIDEASSQVSVASKEYGRWAGLDSLNAMPNGSRLYAHPIPSQQSPAVAVPDWVLARERFPAPDETVWVAVKNKNKSDGIWLFDTCWHTGDSWGKREHTWEDIVAWAYPVAPFSASPSPRITEQDALEIINSAVGFMYEESSTPRIDYWLHEEGRSLLNKLNGYQNGK